MSRDLPPVPNLDHLRNQAKALLNELRPIAPSAKLADAQRVIARQYGFRSWPKLKAHVESVGADPNPDPGPSARAALRKRMQSILDERMRAGGVFVRYTEEAIRSGPSICCSG
jgi:hypothetical protein